jgi:hypothetical protein
LVTVPANAAGNTYRLPASGSMSDQVAGPNKTGEARRHLLRKQVPTARLPEHRLRDNLTNKTPYPEAPGSGRPTTRAVRLYGLHNALPGAALLRKKNWGGEGSGSGLWRNSKRRHAALASAPGTEPRCRDSEHRGPVLPPRCGLNGHAVATIFRASRELVSGPHVTNSQILDQQLFAEILAQLLTESAFWRTRVCPRVRSVSVPEAKNAHRRRS